MNKIKNWYNTKIRTPIMKWLYTTLCGLSGKVRNIAEEIGRYAGGPQIHYVPPTKAEREEKNKKIEIRFFVLFVGFALLFLIGLFAKYYYTISNSSISFNEWNSSAGSFWGAVLGAFVAGVVTIISTVLIIQRSYKIDYHRERLEVMPVLDMSIYKDNENYLGDKTEKELSEATDCPVRIAPAVLSIGESMQLYRIKNVGRGIAYRIKTTGFSQDYEEMHYTSILPTEKSIIMGHRRIEKGRVSIEFYDLYENQYRQYFVLSPYGITTYPPELIRKTERVRYTQ